MTTLPRRQVPLSEAYFDGQHGEKIKIKYVPMSFSEFIEFSKLDDGITINDDDDEKTQADKLNQKIMFIMENMLNKLDCVKEMYVNDEQVEIEFHGTEAQEVAKIITPKFMSLKESD